MSQAANRPFCTREVHFFVCSSGKQKKKKRTNEDLHLVPTLAPFFEASCRSRRVFTDEKRVSIVAWRRANDTDRHIQATKKRGRKKGRQWHEHKPSRCRETALFSAQKRAGSFVSFCRLFFSCAFQTGKKRVTGRCRCRPPPKGAAPIALVDPKREKGKGTLDTSMDAAKRTEIASLIARLPAKAIADLGMQSFLFFIF